MSRDQSDSLLGSQPHLKVLDISIISANKFSFPGELLWIGLLSPRTKNFPPNTEEQERNTFLRLLNTWQGSLTSGKVSHLCNPIPFVMALMAIITLPIILVSRMATEEKVMILVLLLLLFAFIFWEYIRQLHLICFNISAFHSWKSSD